MLSSLYCPSDMSQLVRNPLNITLMGQLSRVHTTVINLCLWIRFIRSSVFNLATASKWSDLCVCVCVCENLEVCLFSTGCEKSLKSCQYDFTPGWRLQREREREREREKEISFTSSSFYTISYSMNIKVRKDLQPLFLKDKGPMLWVVEVKYTGLSQKIRILW